MYRLKNKKILITAGSVWTPIDEVRIITNVFKGGLGRLLAEEATKNGAKGTLLAGPTLISLPKKKIKNLKIIYFKYFKELYNLMKQEISSQKYDIVIHSAAVADYVPVDTYKGKIKSGKKEFIIKLKPTPKIVDQIKKWDSTVFLVKFKLEVGLNKKQLIKIGYKSMMDSNADLMVVNDFKDMQNKIHKAFIIDRNKKIVFFKTKKEIAQNLLKIISNKI